MSPVNSTIVLFCYITVNLKYNNNNNNTILYPNKSYQTVPNNLKVPGSQGPRDPVFQGPRNLKVTFKYELDSKEGPSCLPYQLNL